MDLRDAQGRAADSVIWAENGTGKSSLLSLYFSTYRPSQRLFLGKQAESRARELGDYLRDRDLGFVITEWDTTDDRAEASLLADGPREYCWSTGALMARTGPQHRGLAPSVLHHAAWA